jgi:hypothetical protein
MGKRWDRSIFEQNVPGLAIADSLVRGVSRVNKFGANRSIDTGDVPETVWEVGGLSPYQTAAQSLEVLGGANDVLTTGTGAWTVEVQGLDANWEEQLATVSLNAANPIALSGTWLRVFRANVVTAGSTHANVDNIIVRIESGGTILATILATLGQTTMALYTVPAGKTAYLSQFTASVLFGTGGGAQGDVALFARDNVIANAAFQIKAETGGRSGVSTRQFVTPLRFTEKTDIESRILDVSGNAASVTSEFDLVLLDN